jgi:hypothetical protein
LALLFRRPDDIQGIRTIGLETPADSMAETVPSQASPPEFVEDPPGEADTRFRPPLHQHDPAAQFIGRHEMKRSLNDWSIQRHNAVAPQIGLKPLRLRRRRQLATREQLLFQRCPETPITSEM